MKLGSSFGAKLREFRLRGSFQNTLNYLFVVRELCNGLVDDIQELVFALSDRHGIWLYPFLQRYFEELKIVIRKRLAVDKAVRIFFEERGDGERSVRNNELNVRIGSEQGLHHVPGLIELL